MNTDRCVPEKKKKHQFGHFFSPIFTYKKKVNFSTKKE